MLVDLPPDELLAPEGRQGLPAASRPSARRRNFFRKGNLLALRELALRRTAERVDDDMQRVPRAQRGRARCGDRASRSWRASGPATPARSWCARAARLAAQLDAPWHAVYVETPALQRAARRSDRERIEAHAAARAGARRDDAIAGRRRTWRRRSSPTRASTTSRRIVLGQADAARAGRGGARWPIVCGAPAPTSTCSQIARRALPRRTRRRGRRPSERATPCAVARATRWRGDRACAVTTAVAAPLLRRARARQHRRCCSCWRSCCVAVRFGRGPRCSRRSLSVARSTSSSCRRASRSRSPTCSTC